MGISYETSESIQSTVRSAIPHSSASAHSPFPRFIDVTHSSQEYKNVKSAFYEKKQSTKNCKTLDEKTTLFAKLFALVDKELIRR